MKLTTFSKCLIVLITEIYFITSDRHKIIQCYLLNEMPSTDGLLGLKDCPTANFYKCEFTFSFDGYYH